LQIGKAKKERGGEYGVEPVYRWFCEDSSDHEGVNESSNGVPYTTEEKNIAKAFKDFELTMGNSSLTQRRKRFVFTDSVG